VLFDAAYCQSPLCVPSRMSEITGRYPHSHGALTNGHALPESEKTIGDHFKANGYATGAIGKMHFVDEDQHHGFDVIVGADEFFAATGRDFKPTPAPDDAAAAPEQVGLRNRPRLGQRAGISLETDAQTYEHFLADQMIDWLGRKPPQPFCMWLSFHAPHSPYLTPEVYYDLYAGKVKLPEQPPPGYFTQRKQQKANLPEADQLKMIAAYMGRITSVDTQIGRVLTALEKAGLMDSTIISYTSDHGDMMGERNRYAKQVMYDPAARIPLIFRYPRALPQGMRRPEVVEQVDLYPTFCDLAGLPTPATVQGRSLLPLMRGQTANWPNTAFSELGDMVLVRENQYKATFYGRTLMSGGVALELYDVARDPKEFDNLIGRPGSDAIVARLTKLRDDWMARPPPDVRGQVTRYRTGAERKARRRLRRGTIEAPDDA